MTYIKNNKGFTLIELMATLAILALIVFIAVPAVGNIINNADENSEAASIAMIEKAGSIADLAGLEHDNESQQQYLLTTLILEGYLDIDPDDDLVINDSYVQKVGDTGNTYEYYGDGVPEYDEVSSPIGDFIVVTAADVVDALGVTSFEALPQEYIDAFANDSNGAMIAGYTGADVDVVIPNTYDGYTIVNIGESVFMDKGLESIVLPSNLRAIGHFAFSGNNLTSVDLPDSLMVIGDSAFKDNMITSVDIPLNVESIMTMAFMGNNIEQVSLSSKPLSLDALHIFKDNNIKSAIIPDGIERIGMGVFENNDINHLSLPESLISIQREAFMDNEISELMLPTMIQTIGQSAFEQNSIAHVRVPDSIDKSFSGLQPRAFNNNGLLSLSLPSGLYSQIDGVYNIGNPNIIVEHR